MDHQSAKEQPQEDVKETVLVSWEAADRPFKKRGMGYYFNIALIAVIIFLILFFFRQYILIAVLFSLVFVGITLATVPARPITYQITSKGIHIGQYLYEWAKLTEFWRDIVLKHDVIYIATTHKIQTRLTVVVDPTKTDQIVEALKKHLKAVQPPKPTWFDERAQDLTKLINIGQK